MDAFGYFFTNLALLNVILALVAFLLGLLLGWTLKGKGNKTGSCEECEQELKKLRELNKELKAELNETKEDLEEVQEDLEEAQEDLEEAEQEAQELRDKNLGFFKQDIESGKLKEDDKYGLLYTEAPPKDEVDDLTKIKGVAGVLNKKLNDFGVYKYRQIALWTPEICEDFSEKIAFKGRVERDDWIGQCKLFHQEKYNEKI